MKRMFLSRAYPLSDARRASEASISPRDRQALPAGAGYKYSQANGASAEFREPSYPDDRERQRVTASVSNAGRSVPNIPSVSVPSDVPDSPRDSDWP